MQETHTRHGVDLAGMARAAGIADSRFITDGQGRTGAARRHPRRQGPALRAGEDRRSAGAAGAAAARARHPPGPHARGHPGPGGAPAIATERAGATAAMHGRRRPARRARRPAACATAARAQSAWAPERPLRLLVGFAAGGSTDVTARLVAQALGERLGQPVVVENRPGAGGNIAAEAAARSAPDGHTLLMGTAGIAAANPALYRSLPFDPLRDFAPIAQVAFIPNLVVVHPELPVRDLAGFIALRPGQPGPASTTAAPATAPRCTSRRRCSRRGPGSSWSTCPIAAAPRRRPTSLSGKIQMIASPLVEVIAQVAGRRLRPLAVTTAARSAAAAGGADGGGNDARASRSRSGTGCSRPPARRPPRSRARGRDRRRAAVDGDARASSPSRAASRWGARRRPSPPSSAPKSPDGRRSSASAAPPSNRNRIARHAARPLPPPRPPGSEQPEGDLCAPGISDPKSAEFCRLRRTLLGFLGLRRARSREAQHKRRRTGVPRLRRSRRAIRSRRWHRSPMGRCRIDPVCSRNRHSDTAALRGNGSGNDEDLWIQAGFQSVVCRTG